MLSKLKSNQFIWSIVAAICLVLVLTGCGGAESGTGTGTGTASKAITFFSMAGVAGAINDLNKTIAVILPPGSDVTLLTPTFITTGAEIYVGVTPQQSAVTALDFTNPVVYTVTATDGSTTNYTVTVEAMTTSNIVSQIKSINASSTSYHVLVIKNDKTIWSWGGNDACQLGPQISCATTNIMTTPTQVTALGTNFTYVTAGRAQSFAYGPDVYTYAWGNNTSGKLGDGTTINRAAPVSTTPGGYKSVASTYIMTAAVRDDGSLWAWGSAIYKSPLLLYSANLIGTGYNSVSGGTDFVVALKTDGTVWTWGYNSSGQLGRTVLFSATGDSDAYTPVQILADVVRVWAGERFGFAMKTDGTLWAWGANGLGQFGNGTTINQNTPVQVQSGFASIAVGGNHVAALKSDGSLWTWGGNSYGQLADGTPANALTASPLPKKVGTGYVLVAASGASTLVANAVGEIFGAGRNYWGELGNGSQVDSSSLVKSLPLISAGSGIGSVGTSVGGYQCATSKPVYDPDWIQSHGSYWAAASAHDSYTACLESNSESTCHNYYTLETQYCDYALPACIAVATNASDCPG